ncbi:hypothetical protein MRGA327_15495 [Mycobacterium tuberculosis RGTB327]|nr:hypothetical protein MRGA327_15495 [Mycobacterium tuberculosis RGTB327]
MDDIAAFKLDSLPDITFTVTRAISSGGENPAGFLNFAARREQPEILGGGGRPGPVGPEAVDTPRIRGGKVPFVFRTLPGYTFYASQIEPRVGDPEGPTLLAGFGNIPETSQRSPGWIRITCKGPDDDEELEFFWIRRARVLTRR